MKQWGNWRLSFSKNNLVGFSFGTCSVAFDCLCTKYIMLPLMIREFLYSASIWFFWFCYTFVSKNIYCFHMWVSQFSPIHPRKWIKHWNTWYALLCRQHERCNLFFSFHISYFTMKGGWSNEYLLITFCDFAVYNSVPMSFFISSKTVEWCSDVYPSKHISTKASRSQLDLWTKHCALSSPCFDISWYCILIESPVVSLDRAGSCVVLSLGDRMRKQQAEVFLVICL